MKKRGKEVTVNSRHIHVAIQGVLPSAVSHLIPNVPASYGALILGSPLGTHLAFVISCLFHANPFVRLTG